jgi:hypothetical protein
MKMPEKLEELLKTKPLSTFVENMKCISQQNISLVLYFYEYEKYVNKN